MTTALTRAHQSDAAWRGELAEFVKSAHNKRKPLLIDYLFEPPDHIVPQRLYRYDVYDDYLSRHRDEFEFGYDLIIRAEYITKPRTYGVYAIQLDQNPNHIYVGQTWYQPEERLSQHNTGFAAFHAARPFKHGVRGRLRPDLYSHLPRYRSQTEAEHMEAALAMQLKKLGFRVEGGH
ncbi:MAG TPA: GIY-YIG nuclease family protein [Candidatus Saccharimonadia bacterium]|nr:GIY-YIG nuclease family protein [Candidatus Saccharimonadia bacterium]